MTLAGKTSRSLGKRAGEHGDKSVARYKGSHIWEHQSKYHSEEEIRMKFYVFKICRTVLQRQVSETVNIKMRSMEGSNIFNSKIEYNRCLIPSLIVLCQSGVPVSPSKVKGQSLQVSQLKLILT